MSGDGPPIGSIIRTSYGSGPYRLVSVRPTGESCTLVLEGAAPHLRGRFWINGVVREGDRWIIPRHWGRVDEVFVEPDLTTPRQLELAVLR